MPAQRESGTLVAMTREPSNIFRCSGSDAARAANDIERGRRSSTAPHRALSSSALFSAHHRPTVFRDRSRTALRALRQPRGAKFFCPRARRRAALELAARAGRAMTHPTDACSVRQVAMRGRRMPRSRSARCPRATCAYLCAARAAERRRSITARQFRPISLRARSRSNAKIGWLPGRDRGCRRRIIAASSARRRLAQFTKSRIP